MDFFDPVNPGPKWMWNPELGWQPPLPALPPKQLADRHRMSGWSYTPTELQRLIETSHILGTPPPLPKWMVPTSFHVPDNQDLIRQAWEGYPAYASGRWDRPPTRVGRNLVNRYLDYLADRHIDAYQPFFRTADRLLEANPRAHEGWLLRDMEYAYDARLQDLRNKGVPNPEMFVHPLEVNRGLSMLPPGELAAYLRARYPDFVAAPAWNLYDSGFAGTIPRRMIGAEPRLSFRSSMEAGLPPSKLLPHETWTPAGTVPTGRPINTQLMYSEFPAWQSPDTLRGAGESRVLLIEDSPHLAGSVAGTAAEGDPNEPPWQRWRALPSYADRAVAENLSAKIQERFGASSFQPRRAPLLGLAGGLGVGLLASAMMPQQAYAAGQPIRDQLAPVQSFVDALPPTQLEHAILDRPMQAVAYRLQPIQQAFQKSWNTLGGAATAVYDWLYPRPAEGDRVPVPRG